jgi:hypothetical protein
MWNTVMSRSAISEGTLSLSRIIPVDIGEIFGNPPVLITENRQAYDKLVVQLVLEWKPRNITEWMFVRDMADISWEILRHRRAIAGVFATAFKEALAGVFIDVLPGYRRSLLPEQCEAQRKQFRKAEALADAWFEGPEQQEQVKSELTKYSLDPEVVIAQTYSVRGEVLDKLHRLLALAEARRTAITRNFNEYTAMWPLSKTPVLDSKEISLVPDSA